MAVFPTASMINCYKINCAIGKHCTIGRLTTGFILVLHHVTRRKGAKRSRNLSRNEQNNLVTRRSHTRVTLRWWSVDRSRRNPLFGKSVKDNFVKFAPSFSKPPMFVILVLWYLLSLPPFACTPLLPESIYGKLSSNTLHHVTYALS